jgi:hypothetical protein
MQDVYRNARQGGYPACSNLFANRFYLIANDLHFDKIADERIIEV